MFIYLLFILIIKNTICQDQDQEEKKEIKNSDFSSFNNDFNNMIFNKNFFILYLGTEMAYIKFDFNSSNSDNYTYEYNNTIIIISYSKSYVQFNFSDGSSYKLDNKNYDISYLREKNFLFNNKETNDKTFIINFINDNYNISNPNTSRINYNNQNITIYNIYYGDSKNNITLLFSNVEHIFIKYKFLTFFLIIFGCFSILYGAYHFMFGYIIHLTFFLYFAILEFFGIFSDTINVLTSTLYLFFCFIFSISCSPLLRTNKKDNKKYIFLKLIHGASFGFSVFKTLSYYYILNFHGIKKAEARRLVYFAFSTISIGIGLIFNLFNPFKKYIFLPCSAVSGSYYITKGLSYIVGGYFSQIIAIKENLNFDHLKNRKEINLTFLFINILLIIFSAIFQIKHIEYKQTEMEEFFTGEELIGNDDSRISNVSNISETNKKEQEAELIEKEPDKEKEEVDEGNEDIEIDDQED